MKTEEVARLLGISESAVHKRVQRGTLKAYRNGQGRPLVFDTRSVREAWQTIQFDRNVKERYG
jgi:excisionase family DNA binding protein